MFVCVYAKIMNKHIISLISILDKIAMARSIERHIILYQNTVSTLKIILEEEYVKFL